MLEWRVAVWPMLEIDYKVEKNSKNILVRFPV
jgi:hypothetical protein